MKETVTGSTGYTVTTTYKVDGGSTETGATATAAVPNGGTAEVAFTNNYKKQVGSLKLTKTVTGDKTLDEVADDISFEITDSDGNSKIVSGSDLLAAGGSYTIDNLAVGDYTVTETVAGITGYTLTTSHKVGSGSKVDGKTATATVTDGTTIDVEFINDYAENLPL